MAKQSGSGGAGSQQIKLTQTGQGPRQPPTVKGMSHPAPGALLPKNSPRKPPREQ